MDPVSVLLPLVAVALAGVSGYAAGLRRPAPAAPPALPSTALAVEPAPRDAAARGLAAEQAALRRVATVVAGGAAPGAVFSIVAAEVASLLALETGLVLRFGDGEVELVRSWGAVAPDTGAPVPLEATPALDRLRLEGRPLRVLDAEVGSAERAVLGGAFATAVLAPLTVEGAPWGALIALTRRPAAVAPGAEDRLARFGELVALAVSNAEARAELEALAAFAFDDHLTGLPNKRTFDDRIAAEVERAQRHGRSLGLVIIDLDHFKLVNDTCGHKVGDEVLRETAARLSQLTRSGDVLARVGGEEFAWLLPETDGLGAIQAAERARRAIDALPFPTVGRMTLSAGVAELEPGMDAALLYDRADRALYWAKDHGRNLACRYTPEVAAVLVGGGRRGSGFVRTQAALLALARAVDAKDPTAGSHAERVAALATRLGVAAGWSADDVSRLRHAALLHDVGKVGLPEELLRRPGPLDAEERRRVEVHADLGADMVSGVLDEEQAAWVRHHHERHDGGGYPEGLAGDEIPEGARLLSLAEAWETMTAGRAYQAPRTTDEALEVVRAESGQQFCPHAAALLEGVACGDEQTARGVA